MIFTFKFDWSANSTIWNVLNANCTSTGHIFVDWTESSCRSISIITIGTRWIFMAFFLQWCVFFSCGWIILLRRKWCGWSDILQGKRKYIFFILLTKRWFFFSKFNFIWKLRNLRVNFVAFWVIIRATTFCWSLINQFEFIITRVVFRFTV